MEVADFDVVKYDVEAIGVSKDIVVSNVISAGGRIVRVSRLSELRDMLLDRIVAAQTQLRSP